MEHSKLKDHKFVKGKLITPFSEIMTEIKRENTWVYSRAPEYIWLALVIKYYGRIEGLKKCNYLLSELHKLQPSMLTPKLSYILKLSNYEQTKVYHLFAQIINKDCFEPLFCFLPYHEYPEFFNFFFSELDYQVTYNKLYDIMELISNQHSDLSTDVRFVVLYFTGLSKKIVFQQNHLELFTKYPVTSHDDDSMRMIRPTVRALELMTIQLENEYYCEDYLNNFWGVVSKVSECKAFYIEIKSLHDDSTYYMDRMQKIVQYFTEVYQKVNPMNKKMMILLGQYVFAYKRIHELVTHSLYQEISGRSITRSLIDILIIMRYLLKNEFEHENIWEEYEYYGLGQYKLIAERYIQSGKELSDSHVNYKYIDILVQEFNDKEMLNMDTNFFDKKSIREKAIEVNEKDLYDFYYDYDSAFEHGFWGAIRESSMLKCNNVAHMYHCIPDSDNIQKLPSVWYDCKSIFDRITDILSSEFGLPEELKFYEAEKSE